MIDREFVARMNSSRYYLIFRDTFCDLYPESEQQFQLICAITGIKFDCICSLMTNLKKIYLKGLSLSASSMESILEADLNGKCSQLQKIIIY